MDGAELIIFIRNPVAGQVKTRIARSIGDEKALEIYRHLLDLTREATMPTNCIKHLFYSDRTEDDVWHPHTFSKHVQQGETLGERMKNALDVILSNGAEKAIIIGSDCPELTTGIIEDAFVQLDRKDVVIGPAKDGGYYLLGMKKTLPFLFDDKEWGTDSVFEDTIVDLMENRLSYARLPTLSDVDTIYDLHLLDDRLGS